MAFSLVFYCSLFKLYIITHIIFVNLFNNFHTFIIKFVYYNDTPENKAKNRRVDILVVEERESKTENKNNNVKNK